MALPPLVSLCGLQLYFSGVPDKSSVISIQNRPEPVKPNGVIYVLSQRRNMDRCDSDTLELHERRAGIESPNLQDWITPSFAGP